MLSEDERRTRILQFRGGILFSRRGADRKIARTFEITSARRYWIGVIVTHGEGIGFLPSNGKGLSPESSLANLTREREMHSAERAEESLPFWGIFEHCRNRWRRT